MSRLRLFVSAALFGTVWLCYLPGTMGCSDSMWSIPTAVSLVDHGDITLDEYRSILEARQFVLTERIGGHVYNLYPIGTSILAMPGVIVLRPLAAAVKRMAPGLWTRLEGVQADRGCPVADGEPILALSSWTERLIAAALVAATAVIVFLIAADELSVPWAVALSLLFAFGTSAWSTASRALWQHGPSMCLLGIALLLQRRGGRAVWIGLVLAFAYVVRPTNAIAFTAAAAWVLVTRPRQVPEFLAGAAFVLAPFLLFNVRVYGQWLAPYYRPGFYASNAFIGEALAGNLISPNRGLFVFSPIFLLALAAFAANAWSRRLTRLDLSLAGCVVTLWIATAVANGHWWAGHSYGPRFFTDVLPYLMVFLIPVAGWLRSSEGSRRVAVAALLAVTSIVSVGMHAQGALNTHTALWNTYPVNIDFEPVRVWDWRRPQFLAGLTFTPQPAPPVDLHAVVCTAAPGAPGTPVVVSNAGGTVELRWAPAPGPVAVYIADVGNRPGTSNLPAREVRDVAQPVLVAQRVPRGIYYVRVRAANGCGSSPPSAELLVTVR